MDNKVLIIGSIIVGIYVLKNNIELNTNILLLIIMVLIFMPIDKYKETFFVKTRELCSELGDNISKMVKKEKEICKPVDTTDRTAINTKQNCYNHVTQQIASTVDHKAWCELDTEELKMIENATKNINDSKLETYNSQDDYANY